MIFLNLSNTSTSKSKRVLLPGITFKDLRPVSSLLKPADIIVPMLFVSVIAQISDNIKNVLEPKDIQNISSVKAYRKILLSGINSVSLSTINAISKTLGSELETLSVLSVSERFAFLKELQLKITVDSSLGKIDFRQRVVSNPLQLMKHRKGLSFKSRSVMVANSLFSPSVIAQGVPISLVDLDLILSSSRLFWISLGLSDEEFDFLLKKDAINKLKTMGVKFKDFTTIDNKTSLKKLIFFELRELSNDSELLSFDTDGVTFKSDNNLVLLEKELGFIRRPLPKIPDDIFVDSNELDDILLRTAIEQRRNYKLSLENVYNNKKQVNKEDSTLLKNIRFKKLLNEN